MLAYWPDIQKGTPPSSANTDCDEKKLIEIKRSLEKIPKLLLQIWLCTQHSLLTLIKVR
jgi:hypothetical protein